jgi:tetratricopeptide (TPR) repeat protein
MPEEPKSPFWKANNLANTGRMLLEDGSYDKALVCFEEALKHTSGAWYLKGIALFELKRFDESLQCQDVAVKLDPDNANALLGKGLALHGAGKYAESLEIYDMLIKDDADFPQAWFNKACSFAKMDRDDEAIECLKKSSELDPVNTSFHMMNDDSLEKLRKTVKFEKLLAELRGNEAKKSPCSCQDTSYIR